MFQQANLLEWLSVLENVLLPVSLKQAASTEQEAAALALLAQLGLAQEAHRYPRQLSGGQQSRVALARALLLKPPLLLLDEPFSSLDAITREDLQRDSLHLCRTEGCTLIFVTHDISEAVFLGDKVSVLAKGRLVHTETIQAPCLRDTPAFGSYCKVLREVLAEEGLTQGVAA